MIYAVLAWEFFKIGLFAVGGGLVTVPFLFDLAEQYHWFSVQELADMIAVSQSTPGPIGINMATYAGYQAADCGGGLVATLAEVLPSMIIIYLIARMLHKWQENQYIQKILAGIRPAVMALILFAGWDLAKVTIHDYKTLGLLTMLTVAMHFYRRSAILYIIVAAVAGLLLQI